MVEDVFRVDSVMRKSKLHLRGHQVRAEIVKQSGVTSVLGIVLDLGDIAETGRAGSGGRVDSWRRRQVGPRPNIANGSKTCVASTAGSQGRRTPRVVHRVTASTPRVRGCRSARARGCREGGEPANPARVPTSGRSERSRRD